METNIEKRIKHLRVTFLPEELLLLVKKAETFYHNKEIKRAEALLNIIENVCKKRGVVIHTGTTAPKTVDYKKIRKLYGSNGLQNVSKHLDVWR